MEAACTCNALLWPKHMLHVAAFNLGQGKDKYCTVDGPVPNRLPVISMSTRFHDKTVETADNPVYNVPRVESLENTQKTFTKKKFL